ncbi:ABC-type multidrug/protein/lipid transport system, ATPase component [Streptococcus mutans 15VF2]|uniref:ABC transporter ATP-binding protein n=1 Tax=Streptococcus mutans TaxID=1309 RepID=UPI0002B5F559|nr:ABC transporter ATP-binding protein [Streptococcus mutans]EMB73067.1 ABC-type multidrug/protein/lipid transport system, ATPase component [Streptococcus mutans 15VF2]
MRSLAKYDIKNFILTVIISMLFYPVVNLFLAIILKKLIDSGLTKDIDILMSSIIECFIVCILLTLSIYFKLFFKKRFIKNVSWRYRNDFYSSVLDADYTSFKKNSASYINTMTVDMDTVDNKFIDSFFEILTNIGLLIVSIVGMLFIDITLSIVVLIVIAVPFIISIMTGGIIQKRQLEFQENNNIFLQNVKEVVNGFLVIKSFGLQKRESNKFSVANYDRAASGFSLNLFSVFSESLFNFFSFNTFLVAYGLGMYLLITRNLSLGSITAIVQLTNFVVLPINKLGTEVGNFYAGKAVYLTLLDKQSNLKESKKHKNNDKKISKETLIRGVKFDNVSFSYDNHSDEVLRQVNFVLEKNKKYVLVGSSGSGKSTLMKLLMRFYELDKNGQGEILIDDDSLLDIDEKSLYSLLGIVDQDIFIFNGTIRDNITLGEDYMDEELLSVIAASGLSNLIKKVGLDYNIGECGEELSGGQRQRIAIARLLTRKTPIMIFDEATSSLDKKTTFDIEKTILDLKNTTALVSSHKLDMELLRKYDSIIFLKDGVVSEIGGFDSLMSVKGDFYELYSQESEI